MPSTPIDQRLRPIRGMMRNIPGLFGIRLEEEPKFYVILREGQKQIRKYRPFILAQTMIRGNFETARELGFKRLFRFLQGQNNLHDSIPMTAPVFQVRGDRMSLTSIPEAHAPLKESWIISFILPARYSVGNLPQPIDSSIKLIKVPSITVASLRYNGVNTELQMDLKTQELFSWLDSHPNYKTISEPRFAQYDSPYVISFFRRNEIQISLVNAEKPQKKFH